MKFRNIIDLDYETRSEANLKVVGAFKYAKHHSTEILCFSYKINDEPVRRWKPDTILPVRFLKLISDPTTQIVAHNAMFEYAITKYVLPKMMKVDGAPVLYFHKYKIPTIEQYKCTAAKAAACGLPRDLENAAIVMKLPIQKNMDGRKLIQKYCKPTTGWKQWKILQDKDEPKKYYNDYFDLEAIYDYCDTDVEVEHLLDKKLPDLTPYEQDTWVRNIKMNERGISVDVDAARKIIKLNRQLVKQENALARKLTKGAIKTVSQIQELQNWLRTQGVFTLDLQAATVQSLIESEDTPAVAKRVLKARQVVSMTSNKKYVALVKRADEDGRVRDNTMYHGAATGREAGRGVQVQNLPRGSHKDTDYLIECLKRCEDIEDVYLLGEPAKVFSSCIRGMFTASKGKTMVASDANAIECRVLNWLAGQDDVIEAFRNGTDQYKKLASKIFNMPVEAIADDGLERFVGKQGELASGYGVGAVKFANMCAQYGRIIPKELAEKTIKIYRATHPKVVKLWRLYEDAAVKAIRLKTSVTVGKVTWFYKNEFLWCRLPSGRNLSFPYPSIRMERAPWGAQVPKIYYWRIDPTTKKWVNRATYGGSLVESVCQATARDIIVQGIKNIEDAGYDYLFQVHDEVIGQNDTNVIDLAEYSRLLAKPAPWYKDLPLKYGGWSGPRYKKG